MFIIHTKLTSLNEKLWLINTFILISAGFVYEVNQVTQFPPCSLKMKMKCYLGQLNLGNVNIIRTCFSVRQ